MVYKVDGNPQLDTCDWIMYSNILKLNWNLQTIPFKIKALLGMLARLPWGRSDVLGLMNGKYEGVYVKYASLIVSCHG